MVQEYLFVTTVCIYSTCHVAEYLEENFSSVLYDIASSRRRIQSLFFVFTKATPTAMHPPMKRVTFAY